MKKFKIIAILMTVLILLTGCNAFKKVEKEEIEENIIPVELGKVELGDIYNEFILSGRVLSETDGIVIPEIPGKVKEIKVKSGEKVNKGDVLFIMENSEIDEQVKELEKALGALKNKKSQLEKEMGKETNYQAKQIEEPILLAMADVEIPDMNMNPEELDTEIEGGDGEPGEMPVPQLPQTPMPMPEMDLSIIYELDAKISELSSAYDKAKKAQEKLIVKSSQDGTVSMINIQENGIAMNTEPAMIISDLNNMSIELNGTESLITKINEGHKVRVEIPSLGLENVEGSVNSVSIMPSIKTGLYSIKIKIPSNVDLKPGMIGKVFFQLDKKENIVVVDSNSIIEKNGDHIVYLVENNKAIERIVKTGMETGDKIEILSGLKKGEKIIIKGQNFVKNGDSVKVLGGDN